MKYTGDKRNLLRSFCVVCCMLVLVLNSCAQEPLQWLEYKPQGANKKGKKIVLISGDEEYRSEESLPMLAKILSTHHGFEAVVLFAIDPKSGQIDPEYTQNIPGLGQLQDADLVIIATRFRELPEEQMKYIDDYLKQGKPVIGLRTATHGFNFPKESSSAYKHYAYNAQSKGWEGGFGRVVLGETWINHHGDHAKEGTRALINGMQAKNPVLQGVGDIWVPSDVYGISGPMKGSTILLFGQPTRGMQASSRSNTDKSLMPVAWIKDYQLLGGKKGRAYTTTMGASVDLASTDLRRLLVNEVYQALGFQDQITPALNVSFVGEFNPSMFGFGKHKKGMYPKDYQ
ncbi:ThuA domain-containing protein [Sphingobacterium sp. JB170]|uniref:ThuA domain-containing protein n=1 Tax=Sphingobacterium sp. JB170 TaxID=1434842 RepID=UPI00097ED3F6|nr:ThuA domain-containing protein [Sphingobacterium sp. JB170]SJN20468.1 hypothetical protein-signal peptide and transmembrane prediction [Sphingobacterium sp. JB170]